MAACPIRTDGRYAAASLLHPEGASPGPRLLGYCRAEAWSKCILGFLGIHFSLLAWLVDICPDQGVKGPTVHNRKCLRGLRETSQVLESVQGSQGLKYMISSIAFPHPAESHRRAAAPSQVFTGTT